MLKNYREDFRNENIALIFISNSWEDFEIQLSFQFLLLEFNDNEFYNHCCIISIYGRDDNNLMRNLVKIFMECTPPIVL